MLETWVWSLGWKDPLKKGKATHSSILAWRIPGTVYPWGHRESDMTEWLSFHFTSIESVMLSKHLILCCPLLLLPLIFPSIRVFSNESALCIGWPKYWSVSISPSNIYTGLIFFRIDQFDLLAIQGTLKSLLQHPNSKASFLWHLAFFMVPLSHPYRTTGKVFCSTCH